MVRRKKSRRRNASKSKTRGSKRKSSRKKGKAFGGYAISFAGRNETVEQVFGRGKVAPSEMTKKLWRFIKTKKLSSK